MIGCTAVWEASASRHHGGPIKDPLEIFQISQQYCSEAFQGEIPGKFREIPVHGDPHAEDFMDFFMDLMIVVIVVVRWQQDKNGKEAKQRKKKESLVTKPSLLKESLIIPEESMHFIRRSSLIFW